jgi:LysR family transcriptional regulator for metE and metH
MLEIRHLKTLSALRAQGSLAAAAEHLHLTPSALSHQLKELEQWLSMSLLNRKTKPLQFTAAGLRLLQLADQVLPLVQYTRAELTRLAHGQTGRLLLASECHSCFDWLMPVLNRYRQDFPDVDLDFASGFEPEPHTLLQQGEIDLLITTDCLPLTGVEYLRLFDYESRLVLSPSHPLAALAVIPPEAVAEQTLIAYPVDQARLDIVAGYLTPYGLQPAKLRTTDLTPMLIQLVASGRGIAALPDWVVRDYEQKGWVVSRRLTPKAAEIGAPAANDSGLRRTLYAAVRQADAEVVFMQGFLALLTKMTQGR